MIEIQTILIFNFFYSCCPIIKREKKIASNQFNTIEILLV